MSGIFGEINPMLILMSLVGMFIVFVGLWKLAFCIRNLKAYRLKEYVEKFPNKFDKKVVEFCEVIKPNKDLATNPRKYVARYMNIILTGMAFLVVVYFSS